jgi:TolA-binding protein
MPIPSEETVPTGFNPIEFWDQNKSKVITYGALLIVGLAAFGVYQVSTQKTLAEAQVLYAQADKAEDYRQIIQKFPRTVTAGNAYLMLAAQLRNESKYDDAVSTLHDFISQFPDHPLAAGGALDLAVTLESQGKLDEALDAYQQVTVKYASTYAAPLALMQQAGLLQSKGKIDEAKRTYETVISQYPESYFAQMANQDLRMLHK